MVRIGLHVSRSNLVLVLACMLQLLGCFFSGPELEWHTTYYKPRSTVSKNNPS